MTVKLNEPAFEQAKRLIEQGKYVIDERDQWSEHQPSTDEENAYLQVHGIKEYGKCIWAWIRTRMKTTREDTHFPTAILSRSIAVACFLPKAGRGNITMRTLNGPPPICTECLRESKNEGAGSLSSGRLDPAPSPLGKDVLKELVTPPVATSKRG